MRISPSNRILINPSIGAAASRPRAGAVGTNGANGAASAPKLPESKFDTVTIESDNSFQKQLQGKISREVRTATTTGTVNSLREQVQSGSYQVNAQNIARCLLFFEEV